METQRWINRSQPQTLQIAVFLLYMNAVFSLIFGQHYDWYVLAVFEVTGATDSIRTIARLVWFGAIVAAAAGGFGIANEKKWGYYAGLGAAIAPLAARTIVLILAQISPFTADVIPLMFDIALLALLVHPMSRDYQRIWFK